MASCAPLWLELLNNANGYEEDTSPRSRSPSPPLKPLPLPLPSAPSPPVSPLLPSAPSPPVSPLLPSAPSPPVSPIAASSSSIGASTSSKDDETEDETEDENAVGASASDTEDESVPKSPHDSPTIFTSSYHRIKANITPLVVLQEAIITSEPLPGALVSVPSELFTMQTAFELRNRKGTDMFLVTTNSHMTNTINSTDASVYHILLSFPSLGRPTKAIDYFEWNRKQLLKLYNVMKMKINPVQLHYPVTPRHGLQVAGVYDLDQLRDVVDDRLASFLTIDLLRLFRTHLIAKRTDTMLLDTLNHEDENLIQLFHQERKMYSGYGLRNRNQKGQNCCFLNSLLQCFFSITTLRDWMTSNTFNVNEMDAISEPLIEVYLSMLRNNQGDRDMAQTHLLNFLIRKGQARENEVAPVPDILTYLVRESNLLSAAFTNDAFDSNWPYQEIPHKRERWNGADVIVVQQKGSATMQTLCDEHGFNAKTSFPIILAINITSTLDSRFQIKQTKKLVFRTHQYKLAARLFHTGGVTGHSVSVLEKDHRQLESRTNGDIEPTGVLYCDDEIMCSEEYAKRNGYALRHLAQIYFYEKVA